MSTAVYTNRQLLDEQAVLAKAGDRAALAAVAERVALWARRQARETARKYPPVEADDAFGEAMLTLFPAIKYWTPERGGFLNYFAFCAGRAMVRWAGREQRRRYANLDLELAEPSFQAERDAETPTQLAALLDDMPPPVRAAYVRRKGVEGFARTDIETIARDLGTTPASIRRRLTIAATFARWHGRGLCGPSAPGEGSRIQGGRESDPKGADNPQT